MTSPKPMRRGGGERRKAHAPSSLTERLSRCRIRRPPPCLHGESRMRTPGSEPPYCRPCTLPPSTVRRAHAQNPVSTGIRAPGAAPNEELVDAAEEIPAEQSTAYKPTPVHKERYRRLGRSTESRKGTTNLCSVASGIKQPDGTSSRGRTRRPSSWPALKGLVQVSLARKPAGSSPPGRASWRLHRLPSAGPQGSTKPSALAGF